MAEKTEQKNLLLTRAVAALYCPEHIADKVLERFEKEETFVNKSGKRFTDSFRKLLRKQMGLKEDYTSLSREEKIAEAKKRITEDFKVAREEIRKWNPVEYLLERALDPLDPMNVVYTIILNAMGAEIIKGKGIRLPPELMSILLNYPTLTNWQPYIKGKESSNECIR